MKTICVIYDDYSSNYPAVQHNEQVLNSIFENYATVKSYDLRLLKDNEVLEGDAFLLSKQQLLSPLRHHILNFKKVILMERNILKKGITDVLNIPADSDVLVVNDSYESCTSTVYELYELGINHLNLIPYDSSHEKNGIYKDIHYAITPGEIQLVPPHIRHIIDIHYRVISFSTLLKLSNLLQLDMNHIHHKLIQHLNSIAQVDQGFHDNYLNSYLKGCMLDLVVLDSNHAILVVNNDYDLVYFNEQAKHIFHLENSLNLPLSDLLDNHFMLLLKSSEDNSLIDISEEKFLLQKTPLYLEDQLMGYCFTFQGEKNLRQMEINLNSHLRQKGLYAQHTFQDIIHTSKIMDDCITLARQAAVTDHTILIRGESGTGKELIAQSIHNFSPRKNQPFVAINCAALPESLLESQLFGYEEGAFTGAQKKGKAGLFEQAHLGTIFLDEIGDISPNLQSQLLRVLQEKQIMRIGSDKIISVDVRIIAATNQPLEARIKDGSFRSDLFYRLNVIPLEIHPLRQRREDILPLFHNFLGNAFHEIPQSTASQLKQYDWPGNVRQLENAAIYYKTFHSFPPYLSESVPQNTSAPVSPLRPGFPHDVSHGVSQGFSASLDTALLQLIRQATAPFHGIGRTALLHQLAEHGISISDGKLRELLTELEAEGLITVSRGRRGCQITECGLHRLHLLETEAIENISE